MSRMAAKKKPTKTKKPATTTVVIRIEVQHPYAVKLVKEALDHEKLMEFGDASHGTMRDAIMCGIQDLAADWKAEADSGEYEEDDEEFQRGVEAKVGKLTVSEER